MKATLDRYFHISERGSSIGTELRAGTVSFFAMAYIILLNPLILGTTEDAEGYALGVPQVAAATALVAGDADIIAAAAATLDVLCPRRINVGAIGNASRTKLAINLILQNNRAALAEGLALAEALGLDGATFLATARQSAAYSKVMDSKGPKMLARDFSPQSHLAQTLKDAELILREAGRCGLRLPLTSVQAELLRAAIALRGPDSDSAAVIEAIRAGRSQDKEHS